jgi:hypothetical protein
MPTETSSDSTGWIVFAATMAVMLGAFHVIAGFVALFEKHYYAVGDSGLVVQVSYTAWGWVHLATGALAVAAGFALFSGRPWARWVVLGLAFLSALENIGFLAAQPVWSTIMIALAVLTIWAVTVHGDQMQTLRNEETIQL